MRGITLRGRVEIGNVSHTRWTDSLVVKASHPVLRDQGSIPCRSYFSLATGYEPGLTLFIKFINLSIRQYTIFGYHHYDDIRTVQYSPQCLQLFGLVSANRDDLARKENLEGG